MRSGLWFSCKAIGVSLEILAPFLLLLPSFAAHLHLFVSPPEEVKLGLLSSGKHRLGAG